MGVSYVSIFSVSYHIVFWICGAANSLAWDYLPDVPQGEEAEQPVSWKEKPIGRIVAHILRLPVDPTPSVHSGSIEKDEESLSSGSRDEKSASVTREPSVVDVPRIVVEEPVDNLDVEVTPRMSPLPAVSRVKSGRLTLVIPTTSPRASVPPTPLRLAVTPVPSTPGFATAPSSPWRRGGPTSPVRSIAATITIRSIHSIHSLEDPVAVAEHVKYEPSEPRHWILKLLKPFAALLKPVTLSLAISLPIALITPLKALFVDAAAQGGPNWHGPDGRPPLAFVMDSGASTAELPMPASLAPSPLHVCSRDLQRNSSTPSRCRSP